jgi:signal transduction histidine kinase
VDAIVRQRRGLLQRVAGPTIRLETRLSTDHLHVRGDAARLEQLLLNLVFNARAAMPCGGAVRIETEEVDGWVALRIQDEGNGLPDHARARLLEDLPDWPRGDGLGLFIVRSIVAEHGGRLLVDSAPGEPTTLTFLLPVEAAGRA